METRAMTLMVPMQISNNNKWTPIDFNHVFLKVNTLDKVIRHTTPDLLVSKIKLNQYKKPSN